MPTIKEASRGFYIGIWFVVSVVLGMASRIMAEILFAHVTSPAMIGQALWLFLLTNLLITILIGGGIYYYAGSLNKARVIPWMWASSILASMLTLGAMYNLVPHTGRLLFFVSLFYPQALAALFHWYFAADGRRFVANTSAMQEAAPAGAVWDSPGFGAKRFLGNSPVSVIGGIIVLCVIVGVVLTAFEIRPETLTWHARLLLHRLYHLGLGAFSALADYFLLGAVIVIPVWLILRLITAFR